MNVEIVGEITGIETIAVNRSIRILPVLRRRFGRARWRKRKGVASVRLTDGTFRHAEVHWFEAHGIGRKLMRINGSWINIYDQTSTSNPTVCDLHQNG